MSLREKLDDFYTKYILGVGEKKEDEALVSIPLGIIIFSPWGIMIEKLRPFMRFAVIFAVLLSLLSIVGGGAYVCRFNNESLSVGFYCRSSLFAYFADILLYWGGLSFFAVAWRQVLVGNPFSLKQVFSSVRAGAKFFFLSLAFLLAGIIPLLSLFILYIRVPNPDWRIEVAFFAVVSLGFFVPFIAVRFLSLVPFALNNEKMPRLWQVWQRSRGNMLRILSSLFLLLVGIIFFSSGFWQNFQGIAGNINLYAASVIEFLYNFFSLFFMAVFLNHCFIQKKFLFDEQPGGDEQVANG